MNTKIIVDTSVWIEFFRNEISPVSSHLKSLLHSGRVVMTGMILAEILQGIKSGNEVILVKNSLESLPFIEINKKVWQQSGEISATLRRKGITIPLSDIIIACAALTEGFELYTIDPHFEKIPSVKLHKPSLKH
jgi:tRNA(fMet)-specific endonuclease VapC